MDQILSSIQDGSLLAGERMPSEAKLAELTGVGRTSVREALAALRLMGVVETRVGDGSYVVASINGGANGDTANAIADAIAASTEAVQLQEARAVFESGMVRLVAARWSPEKAMAFEQLLSSMENSAVSEGYADYIRLHRDFHLLLAQATGNAVVEQTEQSFLEYMDHEGWKDMERQSYLPNRREYLTESAQEHRSIFEAIQASDGGLASELIHNHYARHEDGDGNGNSNPGI
ncbi:FadR family transcriptional regulator [Candidatus Bipolaricaulota bacterium]|nr:FadR family transcriptional regulator [Candidatus Bipolaricaulota bacterium]